MKNLFHKKITTGNGIFQRPVDGRAASFLSGTLISSMIDYPSQDKMDFAFIYKMRR